MNCPNCSQFNPEGAKFCMNCGTRLGAGEAEPATQSEMLSQYLPAELAEKLKAARARKGMVGERRVITMLFCDVKGSTAAAEGVDPEVWSEVMSGAFQRMIAPIYKFEGLVARLMGDGILAFFGAPIAHEDDPERAVLAGMEIQAGITTYAAEVQRRHRLDFGLRVGINTGLVVVGEIGSDLRMEYTAIGDAINLAARMEQSATPGSVQISEETRKLVAPLFEVEALGAIEVKGKAKPVQAFRVLGRKQTPGRLRGLGTMVSPLIGRAAEVATLKECLDGLGGGNGAFVAVTGEAGLGKSSLVAEVRKSEEARQSIWLQAEAASYTRSISYFLWRQVIRQSIGAAENDTPAQVRAKIGNYQKLHGLPGEAVPFLQAMLAVEDAESLQAVGAVTGEALVERMTNAVRTLLTGLAEKSPVVLVLDDLHWADEASLNLLKALSDLSGHKAILIIGMLRPDAEAPSWQAVTQIEQNGGEGFRSIHLAPLAESETDKLLRNLLGLEAVPRAFRDQIAEKAGGNPFFVEELIRSLVDTGQIVAEDQHWRVAGGAGKISLPTTLRGVLSARIDRLPESARHTLQMAAVIGRLFDLRILQRLAQSERVDEQVSVLQKAALVEVREGEGVFRHALIQDAAYDSILLKQRPELHRLTGEALEEMQAERTEEFAALLAHHFFAAEDPRSLKYDTLAGQNAARLYANAEAATHFKRALETGERLGIEAAGLRDLYLQLGSVYELAGRYNEALENYKRLQALGAKNGDDRIELDGLMALATVYSTPTALHNAELAERATVQALEISSRVGDPGIQAKLTWTLMLAHLHSRRIPQALEYGTQALKLARAAGNKEQLAFVLNDLGRVHVCAGDFEAAFDVIREARQLWRDLENRVMLADNLGAEEEAHYSLGHYDEQISIGRQALELSEALDNPWGKSYHRLLMGLAHFEKGDPQTGFQLVREGVELGDSGGLIISSIAGRCDLGWFYGWYGAVDSGLELTDQAIELARTNLPDWIAMPAAIKVRLHLLQGDTQAAEQAALIAALEPPSLPYPHYTLMVELAQFELAFARGDYGPALERAEAILAELSGTMRGELPQLIGRRGDALLALGREDEALEALTRARAQAEELKSKHELWPILASLAIVLSRTGKEQEAIAVARQAGQIVEEIGRSIEDTRLQESFLAQPRVRKLLGAA